MLTWAGRASEAQPHVKQAMRLDPNFPAFYELVLGLAYYGIGNARDAVTQLEKASKRNPLDRVSLTFLTSAYVELGEREKAIKILERLRKSYAGAVTLGVRIFMRAFPLRDAVVARRFGSSFVTAGACCEDHVEEFIGRMRKEGKME